MSSPAVCCHVVDIVLCRCGVLVLILPRCFVAQSVRSTFLDVFISRVAEVIINFVFLLLWRYAGDVNLDLEHCKRIC